MSERDWTEDFELENGNYVNSCTCCTREFTGYKRRTLCRTCSGLPSTKPQGDTEKTEDILAQLAAAKAEIESLQHDLSRHLSITSEQATEILGKEKEIARLNGADPDYGDWFWPEDADEGTSCDSSAWQVAHDHDDYHGCVVGHIIKVTRATLLPDVFVLVVPDPKDPERHDYKTFSTRALAEEAHALQLKGK